MPTRKKTRGALKRTSSDGPGLDDAGSSPKRPRPDVFTATTPDVTLDAPAHKARKPITYKSKARQKARLSGGSPPKLTSFGFNVEHKPKVGRALFHLSLSPRAKAKSRTKLFGGPKSNSRRQSKGGTSTDNTMVYTEVGDDSNDKEEHRAQLLDLGNPLNVITPPRPSSVVNTNMDEHNEDNDQVAPLPLVSPVRPIEGPGLEIRTPLKGHVALPSLHSLSKRIPRVDGPSIPLFAATPRPFPSQLPGNSPDNSPTKPHAVPTFAPSILLAPIPSTPAPKARPNPSFAPSAQRPVLSIRDGSPTKRPPPVFAPTPAPLRTNNVTNGVSQPVFASTESNSIQTPAQRNHSLPAVPPPLPNMSSTVPETSIPATPTAQRRAAPTFTPGLLFPPPDQANGAGKKDKMKVSQAPIFGGLEEADEGTPCAVKRAMDEEKREDGKKTGDEDAGGELDFSMADMLNTSMGPLSEPDLPVDAGRVTVPTNAPTSSVLMDVLGPLIPIDESRPAILTEEPSLLAPTPGLSMAARSRSRSASASGSALPQGTTKHELQTSSRVGSVSPSWVSSSAPRTESQSRRGSDISLPPLMTDLSALSTFQSRTNSLDPLQHRMSQTAAVMMDTPGDEIPSAFPVMGGRDYEANGEMDMSTSPLSSLPEDISWDIPEVKDKDEGDSTVQNGANDDTIRDRSMSMRDPNEQIILSPPFSPPVPTSPVSSVLGDIVMHGNMDGEVDVVGLSSPPRPLPAPIQSTNSRSSSLSSLPSLGDEDQMDEEKEKAPATSIIPVAKRVGIPGAKTSSKGYLNGKRGTTPVPGNAVPSKTGAVLGTTVNRGTPAPDRTGFAPGPATNRKTLALEKTGATPGPVTASASRVAQVPIRPHSGSSAKLFQSSSNTESSTASLGVGKPSAKPGVTTRTRSGASKTVRSLVAPTASTAAKTRTKVVTAPPPPRARITSFMKPSATARPSVAAMHPPLAPAHTQGTGSPRKGQSKDDSDIRGPRRSMISVDTQASLSSLSNALEKLARPSFGGGRGVGGLPPRPGTSMGFSSRSGTSMNCTDNARNNSGASSAGIDRLPPQMETKRSTELGSGANRSLLRPSIGAGASRTSGVAKPAGAMSVVPNKGKKKVKDKDSDVGRSEDDADYEVGRKENQKDDPNAPLRSCVIFVDVRTAEGEDAGSLFVDMLRELGAKIVSRPTPSTTHFVFKSGHQSTLTKHKLYDDPQPFLVGIGWVVECVEKRQRVNEERFAVKTDEVSALDLRERRKAQLPHQMQFMARDPDPTALKFGTTSAEVAAVAKSLQASMAEVEQDAELAAERSKKRTQQKLFPRVRDRSPT